ncbi:thioredoxin family protein [Sulfurospirillum sp. 1307]
MDNFCHALEKDEILNEKNTDFPLYKLYIYGSKLECLKISKRIMCSIKHLPIRVKVHYIYDTKEAIEKGIAKDPSVMLGGDIIIEGLISAEEIEKIFLSLLQFGLIKR